VEDKGGLKETRENIEKIRESPYRNPVHNVQRKIKDWQAERAIRKEEKRYDSEVIRANRKDEEDRRLSSEIDNEERERRVAEARARHYVKESEKEKGVNNPYEKKEGD